MKINKRYCEDCNKYTKHIKYKEEDSLFMRIFGATLTFGFTELANDTFYRCVKCREVTRISPIYGEY